MFKIFKSKVSTPSSQKIEEIANILFPPYEVRLDKDGTKYQIDYSADMNLDSALSDLEDGYNDQTVRNTIKDISKWERQIFLKKISPKAFFNLYSNILTIKKIYEKIENDEKIIEYLKIFEPNILNVKEYNVLIK